MPSAAGTAGPHPRRPEVTEMFLSTEKRPAGLRPTRPKKSGNAVARSQTERLWLIGGGTVALLLTVITYFFFISPQRSETSDVRSQVADAQGHNAVLQHKLNQLRDENQNLAKYQAELAAARRALPASSGVSDFVRSLQSLGAETQTEVASMSVGQPTDASAVLGAGRAPGASTAPSSTSSAAGGAIADGDAPAGSVRRPAGGGIYSMSISAQVTGSPAALTRFLDQLQNVQPRAVLITAVTQTTATAGSGTTASGDSSQGGTTLQLTMLAFVAP